MGERRQLAPHPHKVVEIDRRDHHAFLVRGPSDYATPRIDDYRVAVVAEAVGVGAELRRRDDVSLVLDRTGANQRVPMRLAGRESEAARNRDDLGAAKGQAAVKLWEAQIVADAETDSTERRARGDDLATRQLYVGLLDGDAARQVNVEEMDFAIDSQARAVGSDQRGRVVAAVLAGHVLGD